MPSRILIAREEKPMSGFKAPKDRLTFLLGANAAGDFRLKPMLHTILKIHSAFKIHSVLYKEKKKKTWMTVYLFTT